MPTETAFGVRYGGEKKMRRSLLTMVGGMLYAECKCTVETVFGIIEVILGFHQSGYL